MLIVLSVLLLALGLRPRWLEALKPTAHGLLAQRRRILSSAVAAGIRSLQVETGRMVHARTRDLVEQIQELEGLRGKNAGVIKQMRLRIEQEQAEFDASGARIQAVRSVHLRLLKDLFALLGSTHLRNEVSALAKALKAPGIKLGVRRAYDDTFSRLRADLDKAQRMAADIQAMLDGSFRSLNAEYGFSLQVPTPPDLARFGQELVLIEKSHLQYLSLGNALRLAQPEFAERLARFAPDHGGTDAPIDDEGRAQRRPKHLRLADQCHHLGAGPQVVGAGLHRDQHALGRQQRRARQGGDPGRPINDDVIGPPGEFWRFLVQRFACEAHGAEQPWQALLASALRPVQG